MLIIYKIFLSIAIFMFFAWLAFELLKYIAINLAKENDNKSQLDEMTAFALWFTLSTTPSVLVIIWILQQL